jgi:hypothetical protein
VILCGIIYAASYIQGNFLVKNLPVLDGSPIDWTAYPAERVKSILVWVTVTVLVLILVKIVKMDRILNVIKWMSCGVTAMLFITIVSLGIMSGGYGKKPNLAATTKDMFEVSTNQNFIILLLDAVDSSTFTELLEKHPEYEETFADFTYYRNAMGVYSYTKHSIPFILSGCWFENEEDFEDYSANAYMTSPLFEELKAQDYKMELYEEELILNNEWFAKFDNILPNEWGTTDWWAFTRWNIQMAVFKYAPYDLKRICFVNPEAFKNLKLQPEGEEVFTASDVDFYGGILQEETRYTEENTFKFIHVEGAHLPFQYDADMNIIEDATYESNVEASMTITAAYLDKLKESDAYDNSVIIVMADHGFDGAGYENLYRQNPILFVKGIGEKHDMQTSLAPVSYVDLQGAYSRLLAGADSSSIFDCQEGEERERRYLYYVYGEEDHMYEYEQTGMAWERDTFLPTGREYIQP